jgi:hypothetical protein
MHAVPVPEFWRHVSPRSAYALGVAAYLACDAAVKRVAAAGIPLQTPIGGIPRSAVAERPGFLRKLPHVVGVLPSLQSKLAA